jgi:hypothetical protein
MECQEPSQEIKAKCSFKARMASIKIYPLYAFLITSRNLRG